MAYVLEEKSKADIEFAISSVDEQQKNIYTNEKWIFQ